MEYVAGQMINSSKSAISKLPLRLDEDEMFAQVQKYIRLFILFDI